MAGRGPFSKVGTGVLTLSGANTYSKDNIVSAQTFFVSNSGGSAMGTGTVRVDAGTLRGHGSVSGAVTVESGSGRGAFLAPAGGGNKPATFTQSGLTLQADATYTYTFEAKKGKTRADLVIANGVTIHGATVDLAGQTQGRLRVGLTLTMISNTSATPISGAFANLADGAIVNVNGSNFQTNYSGGDGNDLTLTVVC